MGYRDATLSVQHDERASSRGEGTALVLGGVAVAAAIGGGCLAAAVALGTARFSAVFEAVVLGIVSVIGFAAGLAMIIVGSVLATRGPVGRATELPDAAVWPSP